MSERTFSQLGVDSDLIDALEAIEIERPFPIQEMTIPVALAGHDVIGQARTGTGKTLAFGLPLLQRLGNGATDPKSPRALVVVPTRELCVQVADDLRAAGSGRATTVAVVYGGRAYEPQIEALRQGADVVVGTPGRLLDLRAQRRLNLSKVAVLVLDEADRMLDLGFLPDVERIIGLTPRARQTLLFSATMPSEVVALARRYLRRPTNIRVTTPVGEGMTVPTTKQHVFRTHELDKPELLARVLQATDRGLTIVFCRTKRAADRVSADLDQRGFSTAAVHGDLPQAIRERALQAFRRGRVDVLVATDVAARGLDVDRVTHVVNYECPEDEKAYLHRIGRTGRAGASGIAITLVDWRDLPRWRVINKALDLGHGDPEETYSTSGHLYEILSIPRDADGQVGRGRTDGERPGARAGRLPAGDADDRSPRRRRRRRTRAGRPVASTA